LPLAVVVAVVQVQKPQTSPLALAVEALWIRVEIRPHLFRTTPIMAVWARQPELPKVRQVAAVAQQVSAETMWAHLEIVKVVLVEQEQMYQPLLAVRLCITAQVVVGRLSHQQAVRQATAQAATAVHRRVLVLAQPQLTMGAAVAVVM